MQTALPQTDHVIDLREPIPEAAGAGGRVIALEAPRRSIGLPAGTALLVLVNMLNLADALLTSIVLRSGIGVEANPFVRAIGLPGKVAFVAVLSFVVWKLRPRALAVPAVAFGAVVLYTVLGMSVAG